MEEKANAHIIVIGRVQGVFFRMETKKAADKLGVSGWVRNRRDGSVEAIFEGDKINVDAAIQWCWKGPPSSEVQNVEVNWGKYMDEFDSFQITF